MYLRQSTVKTVRFGPFLDSGDGITPETALTIAQADMRLSKSGGAFAQKSAAGNATHDENGWYNTSLSATDTNTVGELILAVNESGALPVQRRWWVLEEAVFDAIFDASAPGYVANAPVNVAQISGDGPAADNLEADYDGTGLTRANSTIGTATAVTNLVTANMTQIAGIAAAATNLAASGRAIIVGQAQTGTLSTTQMTTNLTGYLADELINGILIFQNNGGTADGQRTLITDYDPTNGLLTFNPIATAPVNGDDFVIM